MTLLNIDYFFKLIYDCFSLFCHPNASGILTFFAVLWFYGRWSLALLAVLLIAFSVWLFLKQKQTDKKLIAPAALSPDIKLVGKKNERWEIIKNRIRSGSAADWRLAIIEADIIAGEILASMGLEGNTIREKLGHIQQGDIQNVIKLSEAHEARNRIANDPNAVLTQQEAEQIIELYEAFFREVEYL